MKDRSEQERRRLLRSKRGRLSKRITPGDRWARRIWQKYGLTPDDVALKWAEQDGKCPICEADLTTKVWVIEHKHGTPKGLACFRGITCAWDNHRVLSIAERAGFKRAVNVVRYLWPDSAIVLECIRRPAA